MIEIRFFKNIIVLLALVFLFNTSVYAFILNGSYKFNENKYREANRKSSINKNVEIPNEYRNATLEIKGVTYTLKFSDEKIEKGKMIETNGSKEYALLRSNPITKSKEVYLTVQKDLLIVGPKDPAKSDELIYFTRTE